MSSNIKAIVFDFDGVILESADVKTDAFLALYASYGPEVVDAVRAHHLANLGVSRFKKFEWIAEHVLHTPIDAEQSKKLGRRFSELALQKVLTAPFVRGAREALEALGPELVLFVASGTPQDELDLIVEKRELRTCFREVHGTPRDKPAILKDLMARYGFTPSEILFVGDGSSDYDAAAAMGTAFLARDTPPLHDFWMQLGVPRVPDLHQLPSIVARWNA